MTRADTYARRFDAMAIPTLIAALACLAGILAADMIATGADAAASAREHGADAIPMMEAKP